MPYWENVTRSFRIAWSHKYLWLIALFAGESGGGGSYNYTQSATNRPGTTSASQITDAETAVFNWLSSHAGLVALLLVVYLVVVIAFFILGAVCEGATVRAAAEHDAERPFNLGWAWRSGVNTMWVVVRFRLLLFLLYLPIVAVFVGLAVAIFEAIAGNGTAGAFIALLGLLLLVAIPYAIYLYLLDRLGSRAIILEQLMARAGIARGHRLLFKRFGRTLLVWLLSVAVALAVGLLLACFLGLVFTPLVLAGVVIGTANSSTIAPLLIVGILFFVVVGLVFQSFFAAQAATYWTLAFRRLDLDYAPPVYAYPPAPIPPAAPQPAPPQPPF